MVFVRGKGLVSSPQFPDDLGCIQPLTHWVPRSIFLKGKLVEASVSEVQTAFKTWCLIKHKDNLSFSIILVVSFTMVIKQSNAVNMWFCHQIIQ